MALWEKLALGALLLGGTCSACHLTTPVPMVRRPDTRAIIAVYLDSTTLHASLEIFTAAMPNEAAVCYGGAIADTTIGNNDGKMLRLTSVVMALQDSADEYNIWFHANGPLVNCKIPVAIGHSHPYANGYCAHSDNDARLLFDMYPALVSIVWCGDGQLEMLFQDGRRLRGKWRE